MDLSNAKEPRSIDPISREDPEESTSAPDSMISEVGSKSCADCRTTKTPLWRGGPNGPKSLCNACGIRYRKKRREGKGIGIENGMAIKMKVLGLKKKWKQRILGEEEEAAVLLMALSSGLLYA